jgi:aldose 1-epimerase
MVLNELELLRKSSEYAGTQRNVAAIERVTLANRNGLQAEVLNRGAALHAMRVPDRAGVFADVVLGPAAPGSMADDRHYFGSTVGRVANRIAGGKFELDGRLYAVSGNEAGNSLHGGAVGFDQASWEITSSDLRHASLRHVSPDGDQGYPGNLTATATYRLDDDDRLWIEYRAVADRPTLVNLTSHIYWNLAGEGSGSAMDQQLVIAADHYLPVDRFRIPTGETRSVTASAFDFSKAKPISLHLGDEAEPQLVHGGGYDHTWVVAREPSRQFRSVARVVEKTTGRTLTLGSTQLGLHFYSGNGLDGSTIGKSGRAYRRGDGFALEPQHFPDAPNHPAFPPIRLEPGQEYRSLIAYRFSVQDESMGGQQ